MNLARPRQFYLILAVVLLSVFIIVETELRSSGYVSLNTSRVLAYLGIAINVIIAVLGLLSRHRIAWLAYLIVSVACFVLISSVTPLTAIYLLWVSHLCGFCG